MREMDRERGMKLRDGGVYERERVRERKKDEERWAERRERERCRDMARHMEKRDEIGEKDGGRGRDGGIGDRENGQRVCETEERGMERDIERDKRE